MPDAGEPFAVDKTNHLVVGPLDAETRHTMSRGVDLAVSLGIVALGVAVCGVAAEFRSGTFPDPVTPRGLPYLVGGFLIVGGLLLSAVSMTRWLTSPDEPVIAAGVADEPGHAASAARSAAAMGLALAWTLLVERVGFLIVTPAVMAALLWLMGIRKRRRLIILPLLFTLGVWIVFSLGLGVGLPPGLLQGPLMRTGMIDR